MISDKSVKAGVIYGIYLLCKQLVHVRQHRNGISFFGEDLIDVQTHISRFKIERETDLITIQTHFFFYKKRKTATLNKKAKVTSEKKV